MPYGRYPERVKDFRKWSTDRVDKAKITDSATGSRSRGTSKNSTRKRRKKRKRNATNES